MGQPQSIRRTSPRLFEALESRTLLSSVPLAIGADVNRHPAPAIHQPAGHTHHHHGGHSASHVTPHLRVIPAKSHGGGGGGGGGVTNPTPIPGSYSPDRIRLAYGFDAVTNGVQGPTSQAANGGAGQTIAIVDAYDDPNIAGDLAKFDTQYNLPGTNALAKGSVGSVYNSFSKLTPQGQPTANAGWDLEIALDVEWAHAIAPQANILLVEAASSGLLNLLNAVDSATAHGATVVSMSWGGGEFSTESSYDYHFQHAGVAYVASSGDSGGVVEWPAASPYVLSVGGTTLSTDSSGNYQGESGWSGSGGGTSRYESRPGYQSSLGFANRSTPDVAYDADPNTGVAVYDSVSYNRQSGWFQVGGTSTGAPQWAGLIALADDDRVQAGKSLLDTDYGAAGSSPATSILYNSVTYGTNFHDITSGAAGSNSAGPGYDQVTGIGTPIASQLLNSLTNG